MNDTAPNVIVIPAKVETPQEQEKRRHLRVAAYCRVSTDSEEQLSSYENQLSYLHGEDHEGTGLDHGRGVRRRGHHRHIHLQAEGVPADDPPVQAGEDRHDSG